MKKIISFKVDSDLYEQFSDALSLSGKTPDEAADACLRWYIEQSFEKESKDHTNFVEEKDKI